MEYDATKFDEVVLALLHFNGRTDHGITRAWKGFDWDSLDRLHTCGFISDPKSKARSVVLTEEGARLAEELFWRHFGKADGAAAAVDSYDLARFVEAQEHSYVRALAEIRHGEKRSHWMWYIFPQFDGLGLSSTSRRYSIKSVAEAEAYLRHPILGPRLLESARAALGVEGRSALEVFGSPDDMKLRSSATLFASVSPAGSVFGQVLDRYFGGEPDDKTLRLLRETSA
jgi:uncharacterized protein (DUF1810 family)